jgi:hypothetical protein
MMTRSQPTTQDTLLTVWDIFLFDKPLGIWSAETIKASGYAHRAKGAGHVSVSDLCELDQTCLAMQELSKHGHWGKQPL